MKVGVGIVVGVLVEVAVGEGVNVEGGRDGGVAGGGLGDKTGRLQAMMEIVSSRIGGSSFFMERTIHGRERGVKERTAVCQ